MNRQHPADPIVRLLGNDDALTYQALRLEALRYAPSAFGSSEAEEGPLTRAQVEARLTGDLPNIATYGAFLDGALVGIATLFSTSRQKTAHKAMIVGMYVTEAARGRKIARRLLEAVIAHARTLPQVEELELAVTVGNQAARRLYLGLGFTPYAVEPRHMKIDGAYYDLEWMELRLNEIND